jgi:hypothetical protein
MIDFYAEAARSFEEQLRLLEEQGRRDSSEWKLVSGLLLLTRGLQTDHKDEMEERKCFARTGDAAP